MRNEKLRYFQLYTYYCGIYPFAGCGLGLSPSTKGNSDLRPRRGCEVSIQRVVSDGCRVRPLCAALVAVRKHMNIEFMTDGHKGRTLQPSV